MIFPDNKTIPDFTLKYALELINEKFLSEKELPSFDLQNFVNANFDLPKNYKTSYKTDENATIEKHNEQLWNVLTRQTKQENSSLITLPYA